MYFFYMYITLEGGILYKKKLETFQKFELYIGNSNKTFFWGY